MRYLILILISIRNPPNVFGFFSSLHFRKNKKTNVIALQIQNPNTTSFANWISNANVEIRIPNVIMISTCASANLDTSPNPIQRDSIGALVSSISYYQKYIRIHLCISIKGLYLHIENFPPRLPYYRQHQKFINLFFSFRTQ